jgi:ParB family chromosome partitioning protein
MISHWTPTVRTYLGRITKAHILTAVREGVGNEAADRLPALLRTPPAGQGSAEHQQAESATEAKDTNSCSVAAE